MSRARLKVYDVYGHREVVVRKTKRGAQAVLRTPKRLRPVAATGPGKSGGGSTPRSTPSGGRAGTDEYAGVGEAHGDLGPLPEVHFGKFSNVSRPRWCYEDCRVELPFRRPMNICECGRMKAAIDILQLFTTTKSCGQMNGAVAGRRPAGDVLTV